MLLQLRRQDGLITNVETGISWTGLFFGGLVFFFRGLPIKGIIWSLICCIGGIANFYLMFKINKMTALSLIESGYKPIGPGWDYASTLWKHQFDVDNSVEASIIQVSAQNTIVQPKKKNVLITILAVFGALALVTKIFYTADKVGDNENSNKSSRSAESSRKPPNLVEQNRPDVESRFIQTVQESQKKTRDADNDMQRGGILAKRNQDLCSVMKSRQVTGWTGYIEKVDSNSDGKGILKIKLSDSLYVKTWNNALSDINDRTMLEPGSSLFNVVAALKQRNPVTFDGVFLLGSDTCLEEASMTLRGKIEEPEFIFKFSKVSLLEAPKVISDAVKATTVSAPPPPAIQPPPAPVLSPVPAPTIVATAPAVVSVPPVEPQPTATAVSVRSMDNYVLEHIKSCPSDPDNVIYNLTKDGNQKFRNIPIKDYFAVDADDSAEWGFNLEGTLEDVQLKIPEAANPASIKIAGYKGNVFTGLRASQGEQNTVVLYCAYGHAVHLTPHEKSKALKDKTSVPSQDSPSVAGNQSGVTQPQPMKASFDCSKAATVQERLICSDSNMAAADLSLSEGYKKALSNSSDPTALKAEQRSWVKDVRNSCFEVRCLFDAYSARSRELSQVKKSSVAPPAPVSNPVAAAPQQPAAPAQPQIIINVPNPADMQKALAPMLKGFPMIPGGGDPANSSR